MDMWSKRQVGCLRPLVRGVLVSAGLCGVVWSLSSLPSFWVAGPADDVASRILVNDSFSPGSLTAADLQKNDFRASPQLPKFIRAKALIQVRRAEDEVKSANSNLMDRELVAAVASVRASLALNPADSFLWLMLYSIENDLEGFSPKNLRYLDQSYLTGPREGWIALRRNRFALAIFSLLRDPTKDFVVSEFAGMVRSDLTTEAAINLVTVGWTYRERLLASLADVDLISREALAKKLSQEGVKVVVPGVEVDERWWR